MGLPPRVHRARAAPAPTFLAEDVAILAHAPDRRVVTATTMSLGERRISSALVTIELVPDEARDIVRIGEMVKLATQEQLPVRHPGNLDLATGVTIAQISGPAHLPGSSRRNAVIVSTGQASWDRPESWTGALDRSPCGTGTSAKMACEHARGRLPLDQPFVHEGILGTTFTGRLVAETSIGDYAAVIPTITGRGWITGFAQYVLAPDDPFPTGYTLTDIWATATATAD